MVSDAFDYSYCEIEQESHRFLLSDYKGKLFLLSLEPDGDGISEKLKLTMEPLGEVFNEDIMID
jgi:hypothetical protein